MTGAGADSEQVAVPGDGRRELLIATYELLAARSSHEDGLAETRHGVYAVTQTAMLAGVAVLVASAFRGSDSPTGTLATALAAAVLGVAVFGLVLAVTWMRAIVAAHTYVEAAGIALEELEARLYGANATIGFTRLNQLVSDRRRQQLDGWSAPHGAERQDVVAASQTDATNVGGDASGGATTAWTGPPPHRGAGRDWRDWFWPVVLMPPPPARSGRGAQFAAASVFALAWAVIIVIAGVVAAISIHS